MKIVEAHPARRNRINVWRLDQRMAITADPVSTLLVGNDEQKIGPVGLAIVHCQVAGSLNAQAGTGLLFELDDDFTPRGITTLYLIVHVLRRDRRLSDQPPLSPNA